MITIIVFTTIYPEQIKYLLIAAHGKGSVDSRKNMSDKILQY